MLSNFLPDEVSDPTEVKTSFLKIRGKTLIFGNVVYQIDNIASIGLVNLSKNTTEKKPMSNVFIALFVILILLFISSVYYGFFSKIIVFIIAIGAWLIYDYNKTITKTIEKYGMTIYTNSGLKKILVSRDKEFIKKVILNLYSVMNSNEPKAITFNFENKSIEIQNNIGSPVVSGNVEGDVVSRV
ncbi:MAG: hypothetical protein F6K49_46825 [Moorea sp. SIO3I6]|nr:hypothetical protein [Moorena sp. SIO3I6]